MTEEKDTPPKLGSRNAVDGFFLLTFICLVAIFIGGEGTDEDMLKVMGGMAIVAPIALFFLLVFETVNRKYDE